MDVSMPVNLRCKNELRMIHGKIVRARAITIRDAPRGWCSESHAQRIASPANGRMTDRVSAVSPRKKPAKRKLRGVGWLIVLRRKKKEASSRTKKGFSVPKPRG